MTLRISEICFNCANPEAMADFWSAALGYHETERDETGISISGASNAPAILMCGVDDVGERTKVGHNRLHLNLSPTGRDQADAVARLEALGARRIDIGQGSPSWVVMADPEGKIRKAHIWLRHGSRGARAVDHRLARRRRCRGLHAPASARCEGS